MTTKECEGCERELPADELDDEGLCLEHCAREAREERRHQRQLEADWRHDRGCW